MGSEYASRWAQAMMDEWQSLIDNETWDLVDSSTVPNDHSVLKGKWVFKVKRGRDGKITRFKARWVVKGYLQQYGLDYDQTFAAVVKPVAFRILFALAAYHDLDVDQMDVATAFLNGVIDQLIYVELPTGFESPGRVCKLKKSLYGLKQSPRLWYKRLAEALLERLGLVRMHADNGVFVTKEGINGLIITSWVDDINLFAPKDSGHIARAKKKLSAAFKMVDMGPVSYYLGLQITRDRINKTITISQLSRLGVIS